MQIGIIKDRNIKAKNIIQLFLLIKLSESFFIFHFPNFFSISKIFLSNFDSNSIILILFEFLPSMLNRSVDSIFKLKSSAIFSIVLRPAILSSISSIFSKNKLLNSSKPIKFLGVIFEYLKLNSYLLRAIDR